MTDWKKKHDSLPHFKPAHETQGKTLEDVLNNIPGLPAVSNKSPSTSGREGREIDITSRFAGMIPRTAEELKAFHMSHSPPNAYGLNNGTEIDQVVYLREGQPSYRQLQTGGMNTPVPLAALVGPTGNVTGKEFRLVEIRKFYIVEGQHSVDLSKFDASKMKTLAVVEAPFLGKVLVPESAVIHSGPRKQQILKG